MVTGFIVHVPVRIENIYQRLPDTFPSISAILPAAAHSELWLSGAIPSIRLAM
jgi:hypothetical protein